MTTQTHWLENWREGNIRFHKHAVHPRLAEFGPSLPPGKCFVPLCGKSLDMEWLTYRGHEVVGAELSPIACRAFFEENKRSFSERSEDGFVVYGGKNVTLWCGDFFSLPPSALRGVTAVYDRAALVALPEDLRARYVAYQNELFDRSGAGSITQLLITFEYDPAKGAAPPYPVMESEVRRLYGDRYEIELLSRQTDESFRGHPRFPDEFPLEVVYRMKS